MTVSLLTDPLCIEHDPGDGHPERPERLRSILRSLTEHSVRGTLLSSPPPATVEELQRVHDPRYVQAILELRGQSGALDGDTAISDDSVDAALLAAGAAAEGVRQVLDGKATSAFALVRPPGHHAVSTRAMGFCLFNNVAVAAAEAHARGIQRVLCVDWDVHHGNGTQDAFYSSDKLLFVSTHQWPLYPGTGAFDETGAGPGAGFTVNAPLPAGSTNDDYAAVFAEALLPIADAYQPELVLVSAGFDAHKDDPLASMQLDDDGFAMLCGAVKAVADKHCQGRMVLTLEGGYDVEALARSVRGCVQVLAGSEPPPLKGQPSRAAAAVRQVVAAQRAHWELG
ncbi:MAG TPA: histone deacetylase [Myxococcales bacterium]|jgi:acetoin utilization deacetylase AcuC-like enzyme